MPTVRAATTKTPTPEEIDRDRMAHWFPPLEAWPENELYSKYPLVLMSERPRYRVHSQWFNTPLLREIDPEPFVKINPVDAEARGITDGSYVECFNDRGTAVAKAVFRSDPPRHAALPQRLAAQPTQSRRLVSFELHRIRRIRSEQQLHGRIVRRSRMGRE